MEEERKIKGIIEDLKNQKAKCLSVCDLSLKRFGSIDDVISFLYSYLEENLSNDQKQEMLSLSSKELKYISSILKQISIDIDRVKAELVCIEQANYCDEKDFGF
jgi:hypothetical protein